MAEIMVIFDDNGSKIKAQCKSEDKIKNIMEKLGNKIYFDLTQIYLLYNGKILNEEMKLGEIINQTDRKNNQMNILVCDKNPSSMPEVLEKSVETICPECKENALIKIEEYKIRTLDCKKKHDNLILLEEYDNKQMIDISKIKCDICLINNKSNSYNKEIYTCLTCNKNICLLCKINHDNKHSVINYDNRNYICNLHDDSYIKYCKTCNKDICMECEIDHKSHELIYYGDILPNKKNNYLQELKYYINKVNTEIKEIILKLEKVKLNFEKYYEISYNIINNKKKNYYILNNKNECIKNNVIMIKDIDEIINDNKINTKLIKIINIYNKISNKYTTDNNENKRKENFDEKTKEIILKKNPEQKMFETKNKKKDNEIYENNNNEITPEMLLQFQQMQQRMINEYLLKNGYGYENKFLNDYYDLTKTEDEELDYGLPQAENGRIKLNPDIHSIGLQNVGGSCYMNATLECLMHIKELSEIFLSAFFFSYPRSDETFVSKHKLSLKYIDLLSQVFLPKLHGNSKYFAPYEFKTLISEMNPLFEGIQAKDAKDLLQFLIENLHSELKMAIQFFSEYIIDPRDQNQAVQYFYNSYESQNKSPIHDILYGVNKIESICLKCNTLKYNFQSYNLLCFPLKEAKRIAVLRKKEKDSKFDEKKYILTLEDCFAHSEQAELFTGDSQMYCNECHCLADAKYQTVLFNAPNVISIVLNRGRANKDFEEEFKFGLDLNIKEYIHNPNCKHGKYYLIGMVVHSGEKNCIEGHFYAYCRMDKNAKWFCYDDDFVTECNDIDKKVVECKPYILFYHYDNQANPN